MTENHWFRPECVKSIPELLYESAYRCPNKTALIYFGRKVTYRELHGLSLRIASFISDNSPSDSRIAILMPNIPQFVICYYGILQAGRIAVPVNFISIANDLRSKATDKIAVSEEITAQLEDSKPSIIFVADFLYPILKQVKLDWPHQIVVASTADFLPFSLNLLYPIKAWREGKYAGPFPDDVLNLRQVFKTYEPYLGPYPEVDNVAQFQYTGGTTGIPKGAMLTHENLVSNILQIREHLGKLLEDGKEVVLGALPFSHVYGLTVAMNATLLSLTGTVVLIPSFDPKKAIKNMKKYGITLFPGVNRMYQSIVDYPQRSVRLKSIKLYGVTIFPCLDLTYKPIVSRIQRSIRINLSTLKLCISGAGSIDASICQQFKELSGTEIVEGYGLSETSPVISVTLPGNAQKPKHEKGNLVGRILPGTQVKTLDIDSGQELPAGDIGIITVKGRQVMKGYYNKPEATAEVLKDGWFNTGDIGHVDSNRNLYFIERMKDMIKRRGENIYASDIEKILADCPLIAEATVIGLNDLKDGEVPVACVVLKDNPVVNKGESAETIISYMRERTPPLRVPAKVIFFASLEPFKNPIGKLQKRKIKEEVLARKS